MDRLAATDPDAVLMGDILPNPDESYAANKQQRIGAEAHLVALVQALHSTADILGHVVYLALGMDQTPSTRIAQKGISLVQVCQRLKPGAPIRVALRNLLDDAEIAHVSALVNRSKHRAIVEIPVTVDFQEGAHGLSFASFSHHGSPYPRKWADAFAHEAFEAFQRHTLLVGAELMNELRSRAQAPL
ncbi:MAG: hypothetical protein INR62_05725 [Rhodospirillales bacterium]|nr:hypothetical protein [Acetobacter sp.]